MTPTPEQLRLCAFLMENPGVPWQHARAGTPEKWDTAFSSKSCFMDAFDALKHGVSIRIHPDYYPAPTPRYSREGKTLLILHNHDCDQFGIITGESPEHLWFTRHGGYFKLSKDSGEVETLKPAEF